MLNRTLISLSLALVGFLATTGVTWAAEWSDWSDRTKVGVGTFALVLGFMAFLTLMALIRHLLGLDRPPPPDASEGGAHH
jgi:hypothetical protein